jgi:hypothetical protein
MGAHVDPIVTMRLVHGACLQEQGRKELIVLGRSNEKLSKPFILHSARWRTARPAP